jgi:methyl-accepting chemotaxis protein
MKSMGLKIKILAGVCSPLILLLVLGGIAMYNINSIVGTNERVDHTRKVLASAAGIVGSAVDMETGMRGYLLAGQDGFLDPYTQGEKATYSRIEDLQKVVSDNPKQVARLDEVAKTLHEWQADVTEPTIGLRRQIGDAETMNDMADLVGEARGKVYFDKFREQIAAFIEREATLMVKRRADFETAQKSVGDNFATVSKTVDWVDHTHAVLAAAARLLGSAVDMETGMRGFLLGGQDEFLDPFTGGREVFFKEMSALQETVSDNPAQVARLKETETIIQDWIAKVVEPAIALRRQVDTGERTMQDVVSRVSAKAGKKYFDAFREQIAAFSAVEAKLMTERQQTAAVAEKNVASNLDIMNKNEEWVSHTHEVIAHANSILASAVDMETGMRGYLLAGQDGFLAPYTEGGKKFSELTASLSETVNDNPQQVALLGEVATTIAEWQKNVTEPTIALRRQIGDAKNMDDMADLIGEARGKKYFDGFRSIMADFAAEEEALMAQRQAANVATVDKTFILIWVCIGGGLLAGVILALLIGNAIANPVIAMTGAMDRLAEGDTKVDVPAQDRKDEVGKMAASVQVFKENAIEKVRLEAEQVESEKRAEREKRATMNKMADDFQSSVGGIVESVASASNQMETTAQSMSATAEETSQQSTAVAAAAEQAAANVQTVASAAEELSSSISEISRQVSQSSQIASNAVHDAERTNQQIQGLAQAVDKIGEVVSLITDIAEQTNLLALNATIEAARAGDAGKGFAVVASEVKNLANQTAKATDEIGSQIGGIQGATKDAVVAIEGIGKTIGEINEIASTIAAAVEEQGAATQEIARNVEQASAGTSDVTSNISSVNQAASETGTASGQVLEVARKLSGESDMLRGEVDKFINQVRTG